MTHSLWSKQWLTIQVAPSPIQSRNKLVFLLKLGYNWEQYIYKFQMQRNTGGKTRNIVMMASTGSGKSRTGNSILGKDYFYVGDDIGSCTWAVSHSTREDLNLKVIDTPGFGDHRMNESNLDQLLRDMTLRIVSFDDSTTNQIDAFVLVVKLDPRPASLKADVEHMMNLFGSRCLKSMILVPIIHFCKKELSDSELHEQMASWTEINRIIGKSKGEDFSSDWYVRWDNVNPRPNQLGELLQKLSRQPPYTHQMFIAAQKEIQERIDQRIKDRVAEETNKLKEKYRDEEQEMNRQLDLMRTKMEAERQKRQQAARQAEQDARDLELMIYNMQEESDAIYQKELKKIQEEKRQQEIKLQQQLDHDTKKYQEELAASEREHARKMADLQRKLRYAQQNRPVVYRKRRGCFASNTRVYRKDPDNVTQLPISELKIGDYVLSFTQKRELVWDQVVIIDDGSDDSDRQIYQICLQNHAYPLHVTHHHYIYVIRQDIMVCVKACEALPTDSMLVLDPSGTALQPCTISRVSSQTRRMAVRNVVTAETRSIVAGGALCSVHCEGDWGRAYFGLGYLLWKYVSRSAPSLMFRFHKWAKSLSSS